ncbi:MAG: bis(5'-nucleosyl)-tetraphosphatase [Aureliella sp.]
MKSEIVQAAGLVILTEQAQPHVLLMQHKSRWDLPKGHADPGETLAETALRETEEETGIRSKQLKLDKKFEFVLEYDVEKKKRGSYRKRTTYFLAWIESPVDIKLTEHIGFKWSRWPVEGPIQEMTIDPLFKSLKDYLATK